MALDTAQAADLLNIATKSFKQDTEYPTKLSATPFMVLLELTLVCQLSLPVDTTVHNTLLTAESVRVIPQKSRQEARNGGQSWRSVSLEVKYDEQFRQGAKICGQVYPMWSCKVQQPQQLISENCLMDSIFLYKK